MTNPDFSKVFAKNGSMTTVSDEDYEGGWDDIVGNNPPSYKQFNFLGNRTDKRFHFLERLSSMTWDHYITYYPGQIVRSAGSTTLYQCKVENTGRPPEQHTSDGLWAVFAGSQSSSLQGDGYIKLPESMGSLLVQWKKTIESTSSSDKIAWPISFPNAIFNVQATRVLAPGATTVDAGTIVWSYDKDGLVVTAGRQFDNGKEVFVLGIGY